MIAPKTAAIVLAAGRSRRMGKANKLLVPVAGVPMVRRVAETALASRAGPVIVVTGHEAERVKAVLSDLDLRFVHNPAHASGVAGSLRAGLAAVPSQCAAVLVLLGDMPFLRPDTLDALIAALDPAHGKTVALPVHHGRRGNPVIWHRTHFPALMALAGDSGARALLPGLGAALVRLPVDDPGILADVDRADDLEAQP
ncbi:MAG: NTP transferase domain-containing protein [Rhodothalassiaceae bacterium]